MLYEKIIQDVSDYNRKLPYFKKGTLIKEFLENISEENYDFKNLLESLNTIEQDIIKNWIGVGCIEEQNKIAEDIFTSMMDDTEFLNKLLECKGNSLFNRIKRNREKNIIKIISYEKNIPKKIASLDTKIKIVHNMRVYMESLISVSKLINEESSNKDIKIKIKINGFEKYRKFFDLIEFEWLGVYRCDLESLLVKLSELHDKDCIEEFDIFSDKVKGISKIIEKITLLHDNHTFFIDINYCKNIIIESHKIYT